MKQVTLSALKASAFFFLLSQVGQTPHTTFELLMFSLLFGALITITAKTLITK
jgi:hypothetical protein